MRHLRTLLAAGAIALVPALAAAQLPVSTGTSTTGPSGALRDARWQISYRQELPTPPGTPTAFENAYVITTPPSAWQAPVGFRWVGASFSAGVPGGIGDGQRRFTYFLRTTFALNAGDQLTLGMQCSFDNFWVGLFINGTQFGGSVCGNDNTFAFPPEFTVGPSSFQAGTNTIEFRWQGDGVTDGIAVRVNSSIVVPGPPVGVIPEPSTYALMATGLAGLFGIARRRRSVA